jgi:hypothetical protein
MTTATAALTRAEAAYAHLASFQRGDAVHVAGGWYPLRGVVTTAQQHDHSDINRAYLIVTGGGREVGVTVGWLLSGKRTITSVADAEAGNVRYFDAAGYTAQNPEG